MKDQRINKEWYAFVKEALDVWDVLIKNTSACNKDKILFQECSQNPLTKSLKVRS